MIQFRDEEVCSMVRALTYYRDQVTGNEYMWDLYNDLIVKLYAYGEEVDEEKFSCES